MFHASYMNNVLLYFGHPYMESISVNEERGARFDIKDFRCV